MEVVGMLFFIGVFLGLSSIGLSLVLVVLAIAAIIINLGMSRNQIACIMTAVSVYLIFTVIM